MVLKNDNLVCTKCNFEACKTDGIFFFNPEIQSDYKDYESKGLDGLYQYERIHFWFKNRALLIRNLFNKYVDKNSLIMDLGAGTGFMAKMLADCGYSVAAGEIHRNGLEYAKKLGITDLYQFDLFNPPFSEHFDVISIFDVIEHFDEDIRALEIIHSMLKPNGMVVCTVPAHQWLWGGSDAMASHKRRYSKKKLTKSFEKAGFEILYISGFYLTLIPMFFLRKLIYPDKSQTVPDDEIPEYDISINPVINKILEFITYLEISIIKKISFPCGASFALIALKRN
ncbi:MAG TPA: class I SAM-dependent methyltransferase [Spirochaetota bacterium]|nr:class I SAM-dependent methyltransferase [Spirochaetota bacterium]HRT77450.1 class I SAM-dependent methyltransferase [Spirochaetota bacterium]